MENDVGRRRFVCGAAAASFLLLARSDAKASGVPGRELGVRPGAPHDQTEVLQAAIDRTARDRQPLFLEPGAYQVGGLRLPVGAKLVGVRGVTRLMAASAAPVLAAERADHISIKDLVLDGRGHAAGPRGVLEVTASHSVQIEACEVINAGGTGIHLDGVQGEVTRCVVQNARHAGIFSIDAAGLSITANTIGSCGNNGIQIWRRKAGYDGTLVGSNRVHDIASRDGGSGQNGNGINTFRADSVIVAQNHLRNCAFSAVRANASSNVQILGNNCKELGEVALYIEFGYEGAVVANNIVDRASIGLSATNFNEGGRLAVVQGNVFRNLVLPLSPGNDPDGGWGIGIHVEADAVVSGNLVERASNVGLSLGWAKYLRDVSVTNNVIREAPIGVAVSVTPGTGAALIKNNLITNATRGAVVGFDRKVIVTGDLTQGATPPSSKAIIADNVVR